MLSVFTTHANNHDEDDDKIIIMMETLGGDGRLRPRQWQWFRRCTHIPDLTELCTLTVHSHLQVNHTSKGVKKMLARINFLC